MPQREAQVRDALLEERRRTQIVPHGLGERPVLKSMYAAVIRAAERWRGLTVGEFERRQPKVIREELDRAHTGLTALCLV